MKTKSIRRAFCGILSAVIAFSAFATSAVTAFAAASDPGHDIIIRGVTEKFQLAAEINDVLSNYRKSIGCEPLKMDEALVEEAMQRAAELSIWTSTTDLMNVTYSDTDSSYFYAETVAVVNSDSAADIMDYIISNGSTTAGKDELKSSTPTEVGIGAVNVEGNKNKTFVCIRMTNSKTAKGTFSAASEETLTQDDKSVNVRTRIHKDLNIGEKISAISFDKFLELPISSNVSDYSGIQLSRNKEYYVSYRLNELSAGDTCAYIMAKFSFGDVNDRKWYSNKTYSSVSAPSFRSEFGTYSNVLDYLKPIQEGSHSFSFTINSSNTAQLAPIIKKINITVVDEENPVEYTDISTCDISLEYDSVEADGEAKTPGVTVYDGTTLLTQDTDYRVKYENNYSADYAGNTARVVITGMGNYTGEVVKTFSITHSVAATLGFKTDDYGYTNSPFRFGLLSGGTITGTPTFAVKITAPDNTEVTPEVQESTDVLANIYYTFTPEQEGTYNIEAVMTDEAGKTVKNTKKLQFAKPITLEVSTDEEQIEIGMTANITANAEGGFGELTYKFTSPEVSNLVVDGNKASFRAESDNYKNIKVTVSDEKGTSVEKTVVIDVLSADVKAYVAGINLTLKGEIGINLYLNLPDTTFKVVMNGPNGEKTFTASDGYINDGSYKGKYKYSYYVAASEMNENITLQVVDSEGNIQDLYNSENKKLDNNTYSVTVNNYFDILRNSESQKAIYEEIKDLADNMYTFGSYAEKFFNGTAISDRDLTAISNVSADTLGTYKTVKTGTLPTGVKVKGYTLVVEEKTSLRVYLDIDDTANNISVTVNGDDAEIKTKANKDKYIEISNIPAQKLADTYKVVVSDGENSYTLECCALSYAYIVLKNYDGTGNYTELCELMKALYNYYYAASTCELLTN